MQKEACLQDNWLISFTILGHKEDHVRFKKKKRRIYGTKQRDRTHDPELDRGLTQSKRTFFVQLEEYEYDLGIQKVKIIERENRYG